MIRHLGAILIVTFITLVVWIFAEAASVQTRELAAASVVFDGDNTSFVKVIDNQGWHDSVDVVIEGSTSELESAERLLRDIKLVPGKGEVPSEPGEHTIDLRSALRATAGLPQKGVTIARVSPATVRIDVDKLVPKIANVRVELPDAELDGQPDVRPSNVTVYVPGRIVSSVPDTIVATAAIDPARVRQLVPGRREALTGILLRLPPAVSSARVDPPSVDIGLRIKSKLSSITLKSVPVLVRMAPRELARFEVTLNEADQFLRDVKVTGPADVLDQLSRDEFKVVATLALTYEDLERGINSKEVIFADMPSSLSFDAPNRLVHLTVRKR